MEGNAVDEEVIPVQDAIQNGTTELSLVDQDCYLKPAVYQNDESLNEQMNTLNSLTGAKLTYTVRIVSTIDHEVLKSWLVQDETAIILLMNRKAKALLSNLRIRLIPMENPENLQLTSRCTSHWQPTDTAGR